MVSTPLHLASHINSKSILVRLVKAGARPDDKNGLGGTSLHNAARLRDPQCAIYLLQAGAKPGDAKDNALCTPLHLRAVSGFGLRRFIESGADVNAMTASGKTALDLASELAHRGLFWTLKVAPSPIRAEQLKSLHYIMPPAVGIIQSWPAGCELERT